MNLYIKWKRPNEPEGEHVFPSIDPAKVTIHYGILHFQDTAEKPKTWTFNLDHIIDFEFKED